jgi:uncharacterized coiled-coil protein SlyX
MPPVSNERVADDLSQRLVALETLATHLERLLEELNRVVVEQQHRLERHDQALERLQARQEAWIAAAGGSVAANDTPGVWHEPPLDEPP